MQSARSSKMISCPSAVYSTNGQDVARYFIDDLRKDKVWMSRNILVLRTEFEIAHWCNQISLRDAPGSADAMRNWLTAEKTPLKTRRVTYTKDQRGTMKMIDMSDESTSTCRTKARRTMRALPAVQTEAVLITRSCSYGPRSSRV